MYNKSIGSGKIMRKLQFKKILNILDMIEIQGIMFEDAPVRLYDKLNEDYFVLTLSEVNSILDYLKLKKILKISMNGIDLSPPATIYAKSNQNSGVEALSLFESYMNDPRIFDFYQKQAKTNIYITRNEVLNFLDPQTFQLLAQTSLFEFDKNLLRFQLKLMKGIHDILNEYQSLQHPLVSIALTVLYTSTIVSHEDQNIVYKNTNADMVDYNYKNVLLSIMPRTGIPHDRDETKALQSFYKDTLFHEFDHACPICNINIAHMLIASHIKPFRDCAHIYEAIDNNNGLLLCRNHDYLFDQGYISFDQQGYIMICEALLDKQNLNDAYAIHNNFQLPSRYMTSDRLLFLQYHRKNIYKQPHDKTPLY